MVTDVHPSLLQRKIIHFDLDAFYASIEVRDDPTLKGKPVVVGGSPRSRGVVSTASYEARRYGVHSAMPCAQAARLCPEAVFIRPDFAKYAEASRAVREIMAQYTDLIEPMSLDEAYLDVTHNRHGLYAVKIARLIQEEVAARLRITGSAGVAPNKLVAKIASDLRKPNGLTVVLPDRVAAFMAPLPLRKVHGIGPVTERRLAGVGLSTCQDVVRLPLAELYARVGKHAGWLLACAHGLDERPVETAWERKSLGHEETFATDLLDPSALERELLPLAESVATDLQEEGLKGRTVTLKVRYADFTRITRRQSLHHGIDDAPTILALARRLLAETEAGRRKIRLLGITVSNFTDLSDGAAGAC